MGQTEKTIDLMLRLDMTETADYRGQPYGRMQAWVYGQRTDARYEDAPFTPLYGYECPWHRFALSALYGHPKISHGGGYGFSYGFEPDGGIVERQEAERFAKGCAKAERAYLKLCADMGSPQSLGHQVAYVMKAIGVKVAAVRVPPERQGSMYRDWRVLDGLEDIRRHIDGTIDQF